jgi:hypothetical protein
MSLFEEAEKNKNPFGLPKVNEAKEKNVAYINQTSILLKVLNEVCSEQLLSKEKKKQCSEHRSRIGDCSWTLSNLQGNVTAPTWANMVNAAIAGMLKTIRNSQPNGEWSLLEFDTKINADDANIERLFFVAKFVDLENDSDLTYRNGVPVTTTVNVNSAPIAPELIEAIAAKTTDDSDLKDMIKQLVVALGAQHSTKEVSVSPAKSEPTNDEAAPVSFDD